MAPKRRVTHADIAKRVGVSQSVVSTALTGRRNRIFLSEATRHRILDAAREMGYQRGAPARQGAEAEAGGCILPAPITPTTRRCWNCSKALSRKTLS